MFSSVSRKVVFDTFVACEYDVEAAMNLLLLPVSDAPSHQQSSSIEAPIHLASSDYLATRFDFLMRVNKDFKACCDVVNFSQVDQFYSIAHFVSKHRGLLLSKMTVIYYKIYFLHV